mmetsp:Transcript_10008/g.11101  ORF Transcript_10008/g.11101 Transcript_10008/m.11101 type:complete len:109 (-) Transcript_10008:142-468(-)
MATMLHFTSGKAGPYYVDKTNTYLPPSKIRVSFSFPKNCESILGKSPKTVEIPVNSTLAMFKKILTERHPHSKMIVLGTMSINDDLNAENEVVLQHNDSISVVLKKTD